MDALNYARLLEAPLICCESIYIAPSAAQYLMQEKQRESSNANLVPDLCNGVAGHRRD
jgi:hypothetical protein